MDYNIYLVDGTGPSGSSDYRREMHNGFCERLARLHSVHAEYMRGPTISGLETWAIGDAMLRVIRRDLAKNPKVKVILAGHSRGGAAAIYIAHKLNQSGREVHGMLLFDAVRRAVRLANTSPGWRDGTHSLEAARELQSPMRVDVIPKNVRHALHMIRDEAFSHFIRNTSEWKKLSREVSPAARSFIVDLSDPVSRRIDRQGLAQLRLQELERMHVAMRDACRFNCAVGGIPTGFSFGNTGLKSEAGCDMRPLAENTFMATHGAMGGAPLVTSSYMKDAKYAGEIWTIEKASMNQVFSKALGFLNELGIASPVPGRYRGYLQ